MNEALAKVVALSVTVVFVAAVIGVLLYGAAAGRDIAGAGYDTAAELYDTQINLDKISWQGKAIPVAAAASIVYEYREALTSLHCVICGQTSSGETLGDCLQEHLAGRAILTLMENENGGYAAELRGESP